MKLRDGWWHYFRRVPKRVRTLDGRDFVEQSTNQREARYAEAAIIVRELNEAAEHRWQMLADGLEPSAIEVGYSDAVDRARALGFSYRAIGELATPEHRDDLVRRLLELQQQGLLGAPKVVEAVLGTVDAPQIMLSKLYLTYAELSKDVQAHHRESTNRNWHNQRRRAVDFALDAIGDKPLHEITEDDGLALRAWLQGQVEAGTFQGGYANKILGWLHTMAEEVRKLKKLKFDNPFAGLRLKNAQHRKRPPFTSKFVETVLLGPNSLIDLHDEARAVVAIVASTGMRPVELVQMREGNVVLDAPIPYLRIRPDGDSLKEAAEAGLKVRHTARDIPLCGSALAAAKTIPNGLVHYKGRSDSLTSIIGKHLRNGSLLPSERHSLYSLRHTFKDRLRAARCPGEIMDM
ncbi:MAG: hypothetical protein ACR2PI_11345, partial [Hyphomicrobiaceae bacterium]